MREIKFRGKSSAEEFESDEGITVNTGDWIYGNIIVDNGQAYIVNGVVDCTGEYISLENWCPIDVKTVGQLTGLKDKHGVEIYEGDKVTKIGSDWVRPVVYNGSGFYLKDATCSSLDIWAEDDVEIEVIGNIYENPELLEAEL